MYVHVCGKSRLAARSTLMSKNIQSWESLWEEARLSLRLTSKIVTPSFVYRRERRVYYLHCYKARRYPNKYLTIIDDAMDQKTTCIPRVRRKTKATCNLATVGTHLVGAIFHSGQSPNGKEVFGSFDYYQWPHDPNLTGSVLLNMLSRWCERYQLPPVLYLQLDNCVKENKNQ